MDGIQTRGAIARLAVSVMLLGLGASGASGAADAPQTAPPPGTIAVPATVRNNLGITFVPVERRAVAQTLRVPGRFESQPGARAEYRAAARGIVEPLVEQYARVEAGAALYRLESPQWRTLQKQLAQAELAGQLAPQRLEAASKAVESAREAVAIWEERLTRLDGLIADGALQAAQQAEAQAQLAEGRARLAEVLGIEQATLIDVLTVRGEDAARNPAFEVALREAATLFGVEEAWLLETVDGQPRWKAMHQVTIHARRAGVVEHLEAASGGLVEDGALVLTVVDPAAVRFRGFALQADLSRLATGQPARLVPPMGAPGTWVERVDARIVIGTEADPDERTFDLIALPSSPDRPAWARPGVAAFAEVVVGGDSTEPEWAIPLGAVVSDGTERVFFLRDRTNPDRVRRVAADLGVDDGRWVVVSSGVRPGDEVVVAGAYELMLSGSGKVEAGGHFHADGTFHAGGEH